MAVVRFGNQSREIRSVAFDKDGTLLATMPLWEELHRIRRLHLAPLVGAKGLTAYDALMGVCNGVISRHGALAIGSHTEEVTLMAGLLGQFTAWPFHRCRSVAGEIMAEANRHVDIAGVAHPLPGVPEVVFRLKEAGLKVGIVTSDIRERTCQTLALIGVPEDLLDYIVTPSDVQRGKPAPDMLTLVCRRLGIAPGELAMIGDSPVDLLMARSVGAIGVGVPEEAGERDELAPLADILLEDLTTVGPETGPACASKGGVL